MGFTVYCLALLVLVIFAKSEKINVDNYNVIIENGILESVEPTPASSDHLNLTNMDLYDIEEGAFKATQLRSLVLANNELSVLPLFVFRSLPKLEYLSLANNKLYGLQCVFGGLKNLKKLNMENNNIDQFDKSVFCGLTNETEIIADGFNSSMKSPELYESPTLVSFCIANGIVKSLDVFDDNSDEKITDDCIIKIRPLIRHTVDLRAEDITGFEKGWYRIHDGPIVKSLNLRGNGITSITREILNDLPKELTQVNLAMNVIQYVQRGMINNRNLRKLDLRGNYIKYIDSKAFVNTENLEILLHDNELIFNFCADKKSQEYY